MTYDSSGFQTSYGTLPLGDLWRPEMVGEATVRLQSNDMLDACKDEETSRKILDQILPVAIEMKKNIKKFWNSAGDQYTAFNQDGCVIGLTWNGPGIVLSRTSGGPVKYLMPKEGGFAWLDGMSIPTGAENVEGAYAFINHMYRADMGAAMASQSGYDSVIAEVVPLLQPEAKARVRCRLPRGCCRQSVVVSDGDALVQSGAGGIRGEVHGCLRPGAIRTVVQLPSHPVPVARSCS